MSTSRSKEVNSRTFRPRRSSLATKHYKSFAADEDLRGQNVLLLTSLLREVLKVPREKVCYCSMSLYHIIHYNCSSAYVGDIHTFTYVYSHLLLHGFHVSMFFPVQQNVESFLVSSCCKWFFSKKLVLLSKLCFWSRTMVLWYIEQQISF